MWYDGDRLLADNTDGSGFVSNVRSTVPTFSLTGAVVSMLGAGGAARGIAYALLEAGVAEIRVFNRTRARAEALAAAFGTRVTAFDWSERNVRLQEAALFVNTTPLGMDKTAALDADVSRLDPGCVVADIVYVPLGTPLLAADAELGARGP